MSQDSQQQLFQREIDFIEWLTTLMMSHPDFASVSVDERLPSPVKQERDGRADILVRRSGRALIVECKNRPIFGRGVDETIAQLHRYSSFLPSAQLVLALPGRLSDRDAVRIRAAGIELWDIDTIARIFAMQIPFGPEHLAAAFNSVEIGVSESDQLLSELDECVPGKQQWTIYQQLVGRVLEFLFCPPLSVPLSESPDESGANRRDFILANFAESGFWNHMRQRYAADYIVVDAKNYVGKIKKREILQMANYLRPHGAGQFGIIFTRAGADASARITAREQWAHYQKLVLVLDDADCIAMLTSAGAGGAAAVLTQIIQDFRLSM
ncbi:HNH endonuclease [Sphingopyxis sp. PAMC25046]|uniref:HNH endonuclease n=1 Tax=Sphingopyxis sp. PAMC25046 TaxID=2565556 RepID=UPI00109DF9F9|nr:HNH endonuclease [Sphingopyxis sp. PAMC25046]QCB54495.1 HNH endonuclease [Sphingopyxis sp. PAMC25046]